MLCVPASMDAPTTQWWADWKAGREQDSGTTIELWDENRLRELLLRPEAAGVRRHYYNPYRFDGWPSDPHRVTSPYLGLSSFRERDAGLFFGRDAATARVLELMAASLAGMGLVVVSGVSGAGKSSLLRAGVLHRLRESGFEGAPEAASWPCLLFTPGRARIGGTGGADRAARAHATRPRSWSACAADPGRFALDRPAGGAAASARGTCRCRPAASCSSSTSASSYSPCASQPDERRAFITALHEAPAATPARRHSWYSRSALTSRPGWPTTRNWVRQSRGATC